MSYVQNDTRKIVKLKDITEEIARMMVLDLRPFDIVEGVSFNELSRIIIPINSRISKFSATRLDPEKISCSRLDPTFWVLAHLYLLRIQVVTFIILRGFVGLSTSR